MTPDKATTVEGNLHSQSIELDEPIRKKKSLLYTRLKAIAANVTVEPIALCSILSEALLIISVRNLALEKSCRVNLAFGEDICDALTARNVSYPNYTLTVEAVQKYSSSMMIWNNIFQSILPVILLLFVGSWSDKHKRRKLCVLMPLTGEIATTLIYLLSTFYFYELPLEVGIFADAAKGLTGGWTVMSMGLYTYISGITSIKTRTMRIGVLILFIYISNCIGLALSGILFQEIGFYGVFSLAFMFYTSGLVYGLIFIKDIKHIEIESGNYDSCRVKKNFVLDFFDIANVRRTLSVCFRKGENNRRARVFASLALTMIICGPVYGELNVSYFFTRYKYGWDSVDASMFVTFQYVINTIGILLTMAIFTKYLKVDDAILGVISFSGRIAGRIILATASTPLWYYVGALAQIFLGSAAIASKAYVSKFVPAEELGQVNSLLGATEAVSLLLYGPLYNRIYIATIDVFPGAFYIAGAVLTVPGILLFIYLYVENQKDNRKKLLRKPHDEKLLVK